MVVLLSYMLPISLNRGGYADSTEIEESFTYKVINCKALEGVSKSTYAFHPDCGQSVNVIVLRVECGVGGPGFFMCWFLGMMGSFRIGHVVQNMDIFLKSG